MSLNGKFVIQKSVKLYENENIPLLGMNAQNRVKLYWKIHHNYNLDVIWFANYMIASFSFDYEKSFS